MKKQLLALLFVFGSLFYAKAQWVTIPDTNFVVKLVALGYGSCLTGNQLDTTCNRLLTDTLLNVTNTGTTPIYDLNGLQYFKVLRKLICNNNPVTSLPLLSDSLRSLDCIENLLTGLPALPSSLKELYCSSNSLTSLPSLPNSLSLVYCRGNQLIALPGLPTSLQWLACDYNQLTVLPALPDSLKKLWCDHNQLTTLPTLPSALKELYCTSNTLTSLPSLPDSLINLDCSYNNLAVLPSLPDSLRMVYCTSNQLIALPGLPTSLQWLRCDYNQLTVLPAFHNSLKTLKCDHNQLTTLPALPYGVASVFCGSNQLTVLPNLPVSLTYLGCDTNQLVSLPSLPMSLESINCANNQLTSLPALPAYLRDCYCAYNLLTALPALPNLLGLACSNNLLTALPTLPNSLGVLRCDNNQLNILPTLPSSLRTLWCAGNQLTGLPILPNTLRYISCGYNQLATLPDLPDDLQEFWCNNNATLLCLPELKKIVSFRFDSTGIACLPNYPQNNTSSIPPLSSVTLCGAFNSNSCPTFWNISGKIYNDANNNCLADVNESGFPNFKVLLDSAGVLHQQAYAVNGGFYSFHTPNGTYTTTIDTTNVPVLITCPVSGINTSVITAINQLDSNVNFAVRCKPGFDLAALSIAGRFRPGNTAKIDIAAGDLSNFYGAHCAGGNSGSVQLIMPSAVHYVAPDSGAIAPTSITGDTLTWNIADFANVNFFSDFNIQAATDSTAQMGWQVCFTLKISPTTGDNNPSNNILTRCFTIVSSFDPNEKEVDPSGNTDTSQKWLTYTIHFQNTGTAEAENIHVDDTLDAHLNVSTFQLLSYSHKPIVEINENAVRFNFPNINLPDSNTNEPASHGNVLYKVKLKDNLPLGTVINNTAYIYFDFNAPVITNTVTNTLCQNVYSNVFASIQQGESYTLPNGSIASIPGTYLTTLTSSIGCDSIITTQLSMINSNQSTMLNPQFAIYPNPATNQLFIQTNGTAISEVNIYNTTGSLVSQTKQPQTKSIDISQLANGVYVAEIKVGDAIVKRRWVKM